MLKKINLLFLLVTLVIVTGCSEDFLETAPTDSISAADAFASPENMFLVLNGLHRQMYAQSPLPGGAWSRTGQSHFMPSYDAIGGNIIHSSRGNGWMRSDLQWLMHTNSTFTTVRNVWYQRYHFIATANNLINNINNGSYSVNDPDIANILGQAYAYRAWAYLQLVTTYAKGYIIGNPASDPGVPLLLEAGAPYTSEPRSSVQTIYDQIELDIDQSIAHFQNASSPANKSHISINAAHGIKARIALSKGDWATAASEAALARQGYSLMNEADYKSGFNSWDLSEVIWAGQVIDSETNFFASFFYYVSPTFNGSQNRSNPKIINQIVYSQIPATDYRRDLWLPLAPNTNTAAANGQGGSSATDPNYTNDTDFWNAWQNIIDTYGMTTRHNTHPYMNVKFLQVNPGTIDPDDVIYMRSSEMYLIEAEAKAMMNDVAGAQAALAVIGGARDSAYDPTIYTTSADLMTHIKWQRHVELWGEGHSYHDHIRWDDPLDQTGSGASQVLYQNGFQQDRPSVNNAWIWKIPQNEIDANPNLSESDQN